MALDANLSLGESNQMAALDNFRINDPNFQNTADELANRAYWEARDRGHDHFDALYAIEKGPMALKRELLSLTGSPDMKGKMNDWIRDKRIASDNPTGYSFVRGLLPPPAQAAPALTPSHLTGPKMGSAPQPALTEAQKHAILTEPAVNMHYDANGNLVPANTDSINAYQGDIVSDNTDETGDYTEEAKKELFGPTANEISDNRRSGIMMNQDPARYAPDGSDLDDGMGNIYSLEGGDKDDVFQSLVKRFLDEGFGREESIAKAIEQMEKPALELFQENSAALGNFMMDKVGGDGDVPIGERNYWPYVPWSDTKLGRYFEGEDTTKAREALPSMKDAERMKRINNPLSGTGGALTDPSTDNGKAALTVTEQQQQQQLAAQKPAQSTVRSTTGGYTGNARGSDLPDMQIGVGERLMRMGMAGLANASQGSLAQMSAMTGAYNDVNQANRQGAMDTFKIEEARRQAHADRVAKIAAAKAKGSGDLSKVKDYQAKSFGFYNRGVDAERILSQLDGQGTEFWKTVGSKVPLFGNALVGSEYRQYDQARRNFVNAVLRRESGAVISEEEFDNANKQYFPQFGDEESEILQKRQNRRTTMLGIRISAGDTMQYTSDYPTSGLVTQIGNMKITTK